MTDGQFFNLKHGCIRFFKNPLFYSRSCMWLLELAAFISPSKFKISSSSFFSLGLQVRQWIADRVTVNSSPASPSTSSPYPGPSHSSDWSTPRRERSSPLRGPHGKFVSPSSVGGYSSSSSPPDQATPQRPRGHADMAELAKHVSDCSINLRALKKNVSRIKKQRNILISIQQVFQASQNTSRC